ncbi:MAG: phosphoadenylyl-sulfate reductase [Blastocatellia bacterium]|nr:phosphoadenylyl-sulfate reductase [Blastocatellia bacterium]
MNATKTASLIDSDLQYLATHFETRSVEEILTWAVPQFAPRIAMTSSFGTEGIVLIDHLAKLGIKLPVIYLDTGYHFAATEELKDQLQERYDLEIVIQQAELSVAEQAQLHGEKLYERNSDACCRIRKVEPLKQALGTLDAWLAALRRDQSPSRANIQIVEWNAKHELVKINPLATWTRKDVWNYTFKHKLPYNRLYDEGYTSIGCWPCTKKVGDGEHERSGRWAGQGKVECGIHL